MIKSMYVFGKALSKQPEYEEFFEPWENPFPKLKDETATVVYAQINDGELEAELRTTDFKQADIGKYLYRRVQGSNGTNLVPTFFLIPPAKEEERKDAIRKLTKKIAASVSNHRHNFLKETQIQELGKLLLAKQLMPKNNYLFTIKVNGKFFGEYPEYRDLFYRDAYQKYSKDSAAADKICAVTYEFATEVWGRIDTLGFTVNDVAFSRNGFDTSQSYKMFPVSPGVVKLLEGARRLAFTKLSYGFYGMNYFVMPRFIAVDEDTVERVVKRYMRNFEAEAGTLNAQGKSLINNERIIQKIIDSKELSGNSIYYDIFFYQKNNSQLLLKLHLSDLLPSRFREIMDAKEQVERFYYPLTTARIPAKGKKPETVIEYRLTFSELKDYFSKRLIGKNETIFHPYFFKILEAVFYKSLLNNAQILEAFQDAVSVAFREGYTYENRFQLYREVKQTFVWLQFFSKLQLFENQNSAIMELNAQVARNRQDFEAQHQDFFKDPARRAAFALGCLTEKLLEKQRKRLKSEPFKKYLKGLNLDLPILRKIHLKLEDKFYQYADELYPWERDMLHTLNKEVKPFLADGKTTTSKTEISYAFSLGMTMQREFTADHWERNPTVVEPTNDNQQ